MSGQELICAGLVFLASCAPIEHESEPQKTKLIHGIGRWSSADFLSDPLPVKIRVFVRSRSVNLGRCGLALRRGAKEDSGLDFLSQPYEQYVERKLNERQVPVDSEAPMTLSFYAAVAEVPSSLGEDAPTLFCLVQFETAMWGKGEETLLGRPETKREANFSLYEMVLEYFVDPLHLRASLLEKIDEQIDLIAPTLRGDVDDSCGFFREDPKEACATNYRLLRRIYREKLRCAESEAEVEKFDAELASIEKKLIGLPPEPPDAEYFTVDLGESPVERDDRGCPIREKRDE